MIVTRHLRSSVRFGVLQRNAVLDGTRFGRT